MASRTLLVKLFGLCFSMMAATCAVAQSAGPITIPNMSGKMIIDGKLDEAQWQEARLLTLDYVTWPNDNTTPPVKTEVYVIENSTTLYIGFVAEDNNPEAIVAHFRDRDRIWDNDMVGVKLDTFNDNRLAYQFLANPHGIQGDLIQNEMTKRESASWDGIWQSKGTLTETGYVVEMAIPLQTLNFAESDDNKIWGAEFFRFYPRKERLRISNSPNDRNNSCQLCQLTEISGFKEAKQGKDLAVIPTLVVAKPRSRDPSESLDWESDSNQEAGLDVRWGITPELSFQGTLNPDFSQVESDSAQLSINNTFALFFQEKRPFFLENADYFSSNYNLVYTRNIGAPDYGLKMTGRMDDHTMGAFIANDESTTFLVPGNLGSSVAVFEEKSTNAAFRYRYDASDDLSMGVVSTLRDAGMYHNYVVALDSKYRITEQDTLSVQWVGSETQYPTELYKDFCSDECTEDQDYSEQALRLKQEDSFFGSGYRVNYRHQGRNVVLKAEHFANGEDLRADLGFVSRVDRNTTVLGGHYFWYSEDTWWNKVRVGGDWDIAHNDAGELIEREVELEIGVDAKYQSYFEFGIESRDQVGLRHNPNDLRIKDNTTLFSGTSAKAFFRIRPVADFFIRNFVRYGDRIDFDNNRLGKQLFVEPEIRWSIGNHLKLDVKHTYVDMDVDSQPLFTANLTDARLTYQFDQRQFLRLIVIHSDIERNQANYTYEVDERSRDIGTQLLYSYKLNPLTKFFVGYSDSGFRESVSNRFRVAEQSIFLKVSYAWLN